MIPSRYKIVKISLLEHFDKEHHIILCVGAGVFSRLFDYCSTSVVTAYNNVVCGFNTSTYSGNTFICDFPSVAMYISFLKYVLSCSKSKSMGWIASTSPL